MKYIRYIIYFSQLRAFLGFNAAIAFAFSHIKNSIDQPRNGKLASIPVGPYIFYFPYLPHFIGLFTEIFLKETYYLKPTQEPIQVLDCGTNIGVALLYIKICAPQARVKCFEPNPAARAVLEKNIAANHWEKDVQVFPFALGKKKGTAEFFVSDIAATSSDGSVAAYLSEKGRTLNSYAVDVDTLSSYIDGPIDFLKMDIEGPEFDVLEELVAQDKLRYVAQVQLECHYVPRFFTRPVREMLTLLASNGFDTFVQPTAPPHKVVGHDTARAYMIFAWR